MDNVIILKNLLGDDTKFLVSQYLEAQKAGIYANYTFTKDIVESFNIIAKAHDVEQITTTVTITSTDSSGTPDSSETPNKINNTAFRRGILMVGKGNATILNNEGADTFKFQVTPGDVVIFKSVPLTSRLSGRTITIETSPTDDLLVLLGW